MGRYATVGGKQGKFTVRIDSQGGKEMIDGLTGMMQEEEGFVRRVREIAAH